MEWATRLKQRRASIQTDEQYMTVRENLGYNRHHYIEPLVYYRDSDTHFLDQVYEEQLNQQATEMKHTQSPKIPTLQYRNRRHSYIGVPPSQPYYYAASPSKQSKRRSSVRMVSQDPEELIQLIQAENRQLQHPVIQKRASLPVVESLSTVYCPHVTDQFEPRGHSPNRAFHIAYPGAPLPTNTNQGVALNHDKHQTQKHRSNSPHDELRSRSRSVSWKCDEEDEYAGSNDVRANILQNKYMEITT